MFDLSDIIYTILPPVLEHGIGLRRYTTLLTQLINDARHCIKHKNEHQQPVQINAISIPLNTKKTMSKYLNREAVLKF